MFFPRNYDRALLLGAATERLAFVKFIEASVFGVFSAALLAKPVTAKFMVQSNEPLSLEDRRDLPRMAWRPHE